MVLVEVKAKTSNRFGTAAEMVHAHKQHKLWQLAEIVRMRFPQKSVRIDVVAVDYSITPPKLEHILNAVTR